MSSLTQSCLDQDSPLLEQCYLGPLFPSIPASTLPFRAGLSAQRSPQDSVRLQFPRPPAELLLILFLLFIYSVGLGAVRRPRGQGSDRTGSGPGPASVNTNALSGLGKGQQRGGLGPRAAAVVSPGAGASVQGHCLPGSAPRHQKRLEEEELGAGRAPRGSPGYPATTGQAGTALW